TDLLEGVKRSLHDAVLQRFQNDAAQGAGRFRKIVTYAQGAFLEYGPRRVIARSVADGQREIHGSQSARESAEHQRSLIILVDLESDCEPLRRVLREGRLRVDSRVVQDITVGIHVLPRNGINVVNTELGKQGRNSEIVEG